MSETQEVEQTTPDAAGQAAQSSETMLDFTNKGELAPSQAGETDTTGNGAEQTDQQRNDEVVKETAEAQEKRRNAFQRRADELTADKYAERKRAEAAEQREAEARAQLRELTEARKAVVAPEGPPNRDTWKGTYEEFVAKQAAYESRQAAREELESFRQAQTLAEQARQKREYAEMVASTFTKRHDAVAKTIPDYKEVVGAATGPMPNHVIGEIAQLENPAGVMYFLAKNPQLAEDLASKSGPEVFRTLARIEAKLTVAPQVSNAPAPGKPVGARSRGTDEPPEDAESYIKWADAKYKR